MTYIDDQSEHPPELPNVEIVELEGGRVMIRELDDAGNLIRETWGMIVAREDVE